MHELPVVTQVLAQVLQRAEQEKAVKVVSVELVIGVLHDLIPEWVQKYFDYASRGTIAEGAAVHIERVPSICRCHTCGEHFTLRLERDTEGRCPCCSGQAFTLLTGREFELRRIEILYE